MIGGKPHHIVQSTDNVIKTAKPIVNPDVVNAIYCDLPTLAFFLTGVTSYNFQKLNSDTLKIW